MNTTVVVSKKYEETAITHTVKHEDGDISIEMALDDFLNALIIESTGLPWIFTRNTIKNKLLSKYINVINDMKESTIHSTPDLPNDEETIEEE